MIWMPADLTPGTVCFDHGPTVPALLAPERWNGWGKPLVRMTDLYALMVLDGATLTLTDLKDGEQVLLTWVDPTGYTEASIFDVCTDAEGVRWADLRDGGLCFNVNVDREDAALPYAPEALQVLHEEYVAWCAERGHPAMSAEELMAEDVSPEDYRWLADFCRRWEAVEQGG